jgi:hypothetical protein
MYGKHIAEVVHIIDDLNGIKSDKASSKKTSWFETSQSFLRKKYGVKGHVINTIVWFFSSFILIIVILSVILSLIIFLGIRMDIIDKTILLKALEH